DRKVSAAIADIAPRRSEETINQPQSVNAWQPCTGSTSPSSAHVVGLKLRDRKTLIFKGLRQQRPFLVRAECRGLPIQRSDGAISALIFQNSHPTHSISALLRC